MSFSPDFQDKENRGNINQSELVDRDFSDVPVKDQRPLGEVKGQDSCTIPCDITVKLLRDEKQSICGKAFSDSLCLLAPSPSCVVQCVCFCVFRSAAAVFACVGTQQQKTDEGCEGGATESSGHPKQSGDEESLYIC